MSLDDLSKVIENDTLPIDIAANYLTLYLGEEDWNKHINKLWINLEAKNKNSELSKEQIKNIISCAMLLPTVEKVTIPDPVYQILFWCTSWSQLSERNWFQLLKEVIKKDLIIQENRKKLLQLGIIDPIDYSPLTRQAYNWLYTESQNSGVVTAENSSFIQNKMQNLVRIYGGAVISNIFTNHKNNIQKVYNWKSGYFFEREIYNIYNVDQIQKIKSLEIQKLNPKYIKTIANK
jgi:hypothetical protein